MAITVSGTTITFNDATTQTTAATAGSLVTTANVLSATSGATVGAVGSYAFLVSTNTTAVNPGNTKAGSNLRYSNNSAIAYNPTVPTGTWRCMGYDDSFQCCGLFVYRATLWLRIS